MKSKNLWEVWKNTDDRGWKVQFPAGIMTYRTKRQAVTVSEIQKTIHRA